MRFSKIGISSILFGLTVLVLTTLVAFPGVSIWQAILQLIATLVIGLFVMLALAAILLGLVLIFIF